MKIEKTASAQEIADILNPVINSLKAGSKIEKCGRCDGTGRVFFSSVLNGVCFDCNGKGERLNAKGRKARDLRSAAQKVINYKIETGYTDACSLTVINDIVRRMPG